MGGGGGFARARPPAPAGSAPQQRRFSDPPACARARRHAQRTNERRYHLAATWGFGAACLFALPSALSNFAAGFAVIVLACIGVFGAEGIMVRCAAALEPLAGVWAQPRGTRAAQALSLLAGVQERSLLLTHPPSPP